MFTLTKENITEYLKTRLSFLDYSKPLSISAIGEGSIEEDGDGFINFVFRVSDGNYSLIVKQSRKDSRFGDGFFKLPTSRNKLEYETMQIRKSIVPEYLPDLYFIDLENSIFVTEDVSYLRIMRFQLNKSIQFEHFAEHIARYMAATNFFTSEYYLDTPTFRNLTIHFMNDEMRQIMDNGIFITKTPSQNSVGNALDPEFAHFTAQITLDPKVILERYKLRHLFLTKGECLIHGDLHTSNIFLGENDLKVIDMEYTFCGPISYDLGYLLNNFISQFAASTFRSFPSDQERSDYQRFVLRTIHDLYTKFCDYFIENWNTYAKDIYKGIEGLQEDFRKTTLAEALGFAASANFSRCAGEIPFPDYDVIEDPVAKHNAICLSMFLDKQILLNREKYTDMNQVIEDLIMIQQIYLKNTK